MTEKSEGEESLENGNFDIKEEVKKLPKSPGVYLMHNQVDEVIYVGKAINLKARVSQYFHHNENRQNRILRMISNIAWFEVIQTKTEMEALILESNLIKKYRPRYNVALRDDENHPYIRIDFKETYPRLSVTTENERGDAFYIGPFFKSMEVEKACDFISKYLGLRTCEKKIQKEESKGHPCLYYALGQCMAPCLGNVDTEEYGKQIERARQFFFTLDGLDIRGEIERKMYQASAELSFEAADKYKTMLARLDEILEKMNFTKKDSEKNSDIFAVACGEKCAVVLLYMIRNGSLSGRDAFTVDLQGKRKTSSRQILEEVTEDYYQGSPYVPGTIMVSEQMRNAKALEEKLTIRKGADVHCFCPHEGMAERFVFLAKENAEMILAQGGWEKEES